MAVSRPASDTAITEAVMTSDTMHEYRHASYEISQAIAPGWERWRARLEAAVAPVRDWMIRELAPRPGATLLEIAAGAGDTGFQAATALGAGGNLICTDFSPAMLDVARRRCAQLSIAKVDFRVMDAEHLELDTDSVDGVLCRFGYMLLADPVAALAETRRVLRPGGRLVLAVWAAPERNPFFTIIASTLVQHGYMPPPVPGIPSPFSMSSDEQTKASLGAAGFSSVKLDEAPVRFSFTDLNEYVTFMADTAGPVAFVLQKLSEQEYRKVAAALDVALAAFRTAGGYEFPGAALVAAAS
jgi:ubiquinone/menaquinone biosynthesis C-methylase UbiE